jgi:hypothetical protein
LKEVAAAMKSLSASSAASAVTNAPKFTPIIPTVTPVTPPTTTTPTTQTNITQNFTNAVVNPEDVHLATLSGVKYGAAVTVASTPKSFMKVGAYDR